jgi:membrane protease YdiL (CAAX protease family)
MKPCNNCGRENEEVLLACLGCGATFDPPVIQIQPPTISLPPLFPLEKRVLNGGFATLLLGVYLAAQVGGGIIMGVVASILALAKGDSIDPDAMTTAIRGLMPMTVLVTLIFGGIAVVWTAVALRFPLKDTNPTGPAWVRGSWRAIAKGIGIGILVGLSTVAFALLLPNDISKEELGPLTQMGMTEGFSQIAWVITALLLAPFSEELLFRGILYAGYRKSLGPIAAVLLTTFIFVLLHITELIHEPLASGGIIALALATLWWRLRSAAIGPAIAVHFGYNAVIVATTLYGS